MIILKLLLICICWVIIIDCTDFITEIEVILAKWLKIRKCSVPKPCRCSLCMTFWTGLIYLLVFNNLTIINLTILLTICFLSTSIYNILNAIKDSIDFTLMLFQNKLKL